MSIDFGKYCYLFFMYTDGAFGKIHKRAVTDDYTSIQVRSWKEQSELKENLI